MNKVRVHGWVESIRILKNVKFLVLRNWNGKIQLTIKKNEAPIEVWKVVNKLTRESVIEAEGEQVVEKVAKVDAEIKPEKIEILCLAQTPLPLDPTLPIDTGDPNIEIKEPKTLFSTRFKHRSLDLRNPRNQAIFKIQAALVEGMEEWLNQNGFLRVFTPLIIGAPSEGGAEVFKVDYFGREAFLRQDPQLHRQLTIAGGFEKIYDLGTSWRAEKSHTRRHICEFR
ncbi:MAG TPA: aspartate--tRNA(Asn) ligase, partial [Candidatus Bathyarchaeota archaeon]|nr:aspartate--tRNA(Asn) ligase [Candidatus Bathyarchaeota archaeon]